MKIIYDTGGRSLGHQVLLEGITGNDNGNWVCVLGVSPMTLSITMSVGANAVAKVHGSCFETSPPSIYHGAQIGIDVTGSELIELTAPLQWLKIRVTNYVAGTIDAVMLGNYIK